MNSLTTSAAWPALAPEIVPLLDESDDRAFWESGLNTIISETVWTISESAREHCTAVEIGRCSHWIRPHWMGPARVAFAFGYGNTVAGRGYHRLPEFDWSRHWTWDTGSSRWQAVTQISTSRPLVQRIALPARTARHSKAAVHTIWTPGSPLDPGRKLTVIYGFERRAQTWEPIVTLEQDGERRRANVRY